ncbi:MAG: rhombotarget lipoprotein [bacterium]|nr:rhombotarget lipoprotein [bacterium]
MRASRQTLLLFAVALALTSSCVVHQRQLKSNALAFLYPDETEAIPPADVVLELPLSVGIGFAPPHSVGFDPFAETRKQALLERIADSFRGRSGIRHVEAIPSSFFAPRGGFDNVDRLKAAFGIDLVALVDYDQFQFSGSGRSSWSYWTIVGAYLVKGEKNETRTILNTVVYDIPSRAMLFYASGRSEISGKSLPVQVDRALRERSERGFSEATDDLIAQLDTALTAFQAQAADGTVRGPGTPAVAMYDEAGKPVRVGGGGALPLAGAAGLALLISLALLAGRRRRH